MTKKATKVFPPGWAEDRVRRVIEYYDTQSEDEALAEDEAVFAGAHCTLMEVPDELVPMVRGLIAKHHLHRDNEAS